MIKHLSLKHGWFYHYRVHSDKTAKLCNNEFFPLKEYMDEMFQNCPDEHFNSGPRSSSLRFHLNVELKENENHPISELCALGLEKMDNYKSAHSKVQMFMLQFDNNTISVETPIWLENNEIKGFKELFDSEEPLTGHIDALRVEDDGKVWIWDYKPKAYKEKYASTQVYFYALMISKRTGIPLEDIMCGYFDENIAYTFKPTIEILDGIKNSAIKDEV